eukprot:TRINITY_DN13217_c0_g1_i2.p1 TRINITY_DN13217_c0_g1~~TRINITY_DN13217_c0_g1_i2.p1  ORF type:complete len:262 (-),score=63.22 TRINITY_DN13217_c0_g1_i2:232-1017(-)
MPAEEAAGAPGGEGALDEDARRQQESGAALPSWALRHNGSGGGIFFLRSEKRDASSMGRGGGFYERQGDSERNAWDSDEEQYDEFGRKKRKKKASVTGCAASGAKSGASAGRSTPAAATARDTRRVAPAVAARGVEAVSVTAATASTPRVAAPARHVAPRVAVPAPGAFAAAAGAGCGAAAAAGPWRGPADWGEGWGGWDQWCGGDWNSWGPSWSPGDGGGDAWWNASWSKGAGCDSWQGGKGFGVEKGSGCGEGMWKGKG